jgi:hypothetical protein
MDLKGIGLVWLRIATSGELFRLSKMLGNYHVATQLMGF